MYSVELEIKDTTESDTSASYWNPLLLIGREVSYALPFTINVTISTSMSQTFLPE